MHSSSQNRWHDFMNIYLLNEYNNPSFATIFQRALLNTCITILIIGLCILLRVYQSVYIETSVRNKCRCPYWWPSSGGFVTKNSNARMQLLYVNGSVASIC
jgi:hypothetical protein